LLLVVVEGVLVEPLGAMVVVEGLVGIEQQ
jgi:hypothetical protein